MTTANDDNGAGFGLAAALLPERLEGWRVLEVGGEGEAERLLGDRGVADFVSCEEPTESLEDGGFQLVHLARGLEGEVHPLAVGTWLWTRVAQGGVLVLAGSILTDPARSQYTEFLPGNESGGERWRWLPGRLALRWMVENSGFDFDRWLGERPAAAASERRSYLQAHRVERLPGLDLTRQGLGR